ncbi:MAG: hypothetical protein A2W35_21820 [Chloroflexi bacterium RBG_16_57_11]|nr:MAG: hypothetical protein A2W35_21820 [Chloroflexi bacterium RBG_16_57_11]
MPLAGGLMGYGYQCGMLWGATLAAGAQAYRLFGTGPQAETEAVLAAQRLVEAFRARNKHIDCSDITEMNWKKLSGRQGTKQVFKFFLKGGPIVCFSMSANYARVAFSEINTPLAEKQTGAPPPPVSCAALMAKEMGASDLHAVMAAGFAGGIGLSGGGCGALGAAIWITGMNESQEVEVKPDLSNPYNNPKALAVVERYLESADYEFECAKIVGRKFESIADHATYLRAGGCAKIIDALAAA